LGCAVSLNRSADDAQEFGHLLGAALGTDGRVIMSLEEQFNVLLAVLAMVFVEWHGIT
jgi:hypothetical protein